MGTRDHLPSLKHTFLPLPPHLSKMEHDNELDLADDLDLKKFLDGQVKHGDFPVYFSFDQEVEELQKMVDEMNKHLTGYDTKSRLIRAKYDRGGFHGNVVIDMFQIDPVVGAYLQDLKGEIDTLRVKVNQQEIKLERLLTSLKDLDLGLSLGWLSL